MPTLTSKLLSAAGGQSADDPPLHIAWALLRNVRTLFGRASKVGGPAAGGMGGTSGRPSAAVSEEVAVQVAERDIEVTSGLAASTAEVCDQCLSCPHPSLFSSLGNRMSFTPFPADAMGFLESLRFKESRQQTMAQVM